LHSQLLRFWFSHWCESAADFSSQSLLPSKNHPLSSLQSVGGEFCRRALRSSFAQQSSPSWSSSTCLAQLFSVIAPAYNWKTCYHNLLSGNQINLLSQHLSAGSSSFWLTLVPEQDPQRCYFTISHLVCFEIWAFPHRQLLLPLLSAVRTLLIRRLGSASLSTPSQT